MTEKKPQYITANEQKLIDHAKEAVVRYNKQRHARGGIDTLYAFALTESGSIYDGGCFEPNISHATICGERHAIANLAMNEGYNSKIESIVVADPVPSVQEKMTGPCGTCRQVIWQFGKPDTTVISMQYIQGKEGCVCKSDMHRRTCIRIFQRPGIQQGAPPC